MIVFGFVFILYILKLPKVQISDTRIVICGSTLSLYRSLSAFFFKFSNQSFPSVRIFIFREIVKFLFILQAQQFAYTLLQKVLSCTLCIAFWRWTHNGGWGGGGGGDLTTLPHPPWLLELLTNFSTIPSEKIIQTLLYVENGFSKLPPSLSFASLHFTLI